MIDSYLTLAEPVTGEFRDRGSKFLAYAWPICTEAEAQQHLESLRKIHPKARHQCYAYRLGLDKNNFRANDDGEPSGTAGKPILGQIDSFGLTNVFIVVVRYFGGTLLGTSGLINAYRTSAQDALQKATIVEQLVEDVYRLTFGYVLMPDVMNAIKKLDVKVLKQDFGEEAMLEIAVRQGSKEHVFTMLKAYAAKVSMEEAVLLDVVPGLEIEFLFVS
ncbi:MAG: YigZ family protein [Saprospiraceae bacterium]|nr:YigZ family protein [Saprospiraceae bacterium]